MKWSMEGADGWWKKMTESVDQRFWWDIKNCIITWDSKIKSCSPGEHPIPPPWFSLSGDDLYSYSSGGKKCQKRKLNSPMTTTISPSWSGSQLVSYEFPPVARNKLFKTPHKAKLFHFCSGSHHWSATVPFFLSSLILSSDLKHKHQPKTNAISHIKKNYF